jgi:hypothetical protein
MVYLITTYSRDSLLADSAPHLVVSLVALPIFLPILRGASRGSFRDSRHLPPWEFLMEPPRAYPGLLGMVAAVLAIPTHTDYHVVALLHGVLHDSAGEFQDP